MDWKEQLKAYVEEHAPSGKGWQRRPRPDNTPEQIATLGDVTKEDIERLMRELEEQ